MEKKIFNLIIVDESGSMSCIRRQAFEGINDAISNIKKMQEEQPDIEQRITLLTFNSDHKTLLYDNKLANACRKLRWEQYEPDSSTPLYDAIGMGISKVNSQCREQDHVLVTIITDGYENDSTEFTLDMIYNLISKLKEQHWTFTLIGTDNLDVEDMAHNFAIDNHLSFKETPDETKAMFAREHRARRKYNTCVREDKAMPTGAYFEDA